MASSWPRVCVTEWQYVEFRQEYYSKTGSDDLGDAFPHHMSELLSIYCPFELEIPSYLVTQHRGQTIHQPSSPNLPLILHNRLSTAEEEIPLGFWRCSITVHKLLIDNLIKIDENSWGLHWRELKLRRMVRATLILWGWSRSRFLIKKFGDFRNETQRRKQAEMWPGCWCWVSRVSNRSRC